ncbi:MAG: M48 family metallopeptidase, partial [Paramuribaculum sp.]|nr:M48 family metallopeptidase [Paramuribaculum sp.]
KYTMTSHTYIIYHPTLGDVTIKLNPRATRISGRWKMGKVVVTAPVGVSPQRLQQALEAIAHKLIARKTEFRYHDGQIITCPDIAFSITRQSFKPDNIIVNPALPETKIQLGTNIDIEAQTTTAAISKVLTNVAYRFANTLILPRAKALAHALGTRPQAWRIGRGLRTLGTCSSKQIITLSSTLVFMPVELRDYIVCHELAHLTEMNHSAAFHRLCNMYCNGREAELRAKLKNFPYPVLR